ncbi:MAG: hypothetical protein CM1200mP8_2390 [Chloroflexota bacterium]|nr:MAG: hypothetical protein CM1200mP8_2390 [Chloroflexota bacterium]
MLIGEKVVLKRNCKVAYLKQENYKFDNKPLLQEVCQEPEEIVELRKELMDIHELLSNGANKQTQETLLARMAKINDHLEIHSQNNAEYKAKAFLSGWVLIKLILANL